MAQLQTVPVEFATMMAGNPDRARIDRRLDSRSNSLTGLARWLESARRQLEVEALALADESGCLVVGAGPAQKCEELAALAPLAGSEIADGALRVSALSTGAAWLCAPRHPVNDSDWRLVAQGCLRILGWSDAA